VTEPDAADAIALLNAFRVDAGPGKRAVPWESVATGQQVDDAYAVVRGEDPRWHFWLRPRGMSKTTDAALVALACLLTIQPPNSRSLVYAVDADQAMLLFERMAGLLSALPGDLVKVTQSRITNVSTGATLTVESSDAPSALGQTPWLVIVDEFCGWKDTRGPKMLWNAIVSSMPKRPDSRLLVISSAGDPGNWTHDVVKQAREGTSWRFSYVPGPTPWWLSRDVAKQREALSDSAFSWYVLNEFAAAENALVAADDLAAAVARGVVSRPYDPTQRYCLGVDLGRKVDASVVAVAHREDDRVVVDRVERWLPTRQRPVRLETVEAAVVRLREEYGRAHVRMDPAKGEQMSQSLREGGVSVEEFTFSETSVDRLAGTLSRLFAERRITVPDVPDLLEELGTVILKTTPSGRTRIEHHSGKHDDQAVATALAAHWLLSQPFWGAPSVNSMQDVQRLPPVRRDTRTLPVGTRRGQVNRYQQAQATLAQMVRHR
jgi:phage terminase large subunit-like protein